MSDTVDALIKDLKEINELMKGKDVDSDLAPARTGTQIMQENYRKATEDVKIWQDCQKILKEIEEIVKSKTKT